MVQSMSNWDNAEAMFKNNIVVINGIQYSPQNLKNLNVDSVSATLIKPVRTMTEYEWCITWYSNGAVSREVTYSLLPGNMVDGVPLLNVYGQKVVLNMKENNND